MTLHYDYFSGHLYSVETSLKKSVAVYTRKYYRVKIGITNNPERRAKEHARNGTWKRMIVKYYTTSVKYINDMERIIISHHWDRVENEVGGGGGPNGRAPYYLYVLVE
ncbi:MAG: hypothetical protein FGM14_10940 [Flavobacteriales bacterium]|nr:hypothetical protein [Flavobacteriales bacterium]